MILQDPPFGCTQNEWDIKPDLLKMWVELMRVAKDNTVIVMFATQPFASELILSNLKAFRYDLIWEKDRASGHLNSNKMPLRAHEHILVFYRKSGTYNPQKTFGHKPSNNNGKRKKDTTNYGKFEHMRGGGNTDRFPRSLIYAEVVNSQHEPIHPTQKPVDLFRYLIRTYSNPGDVVFDGYGGSGITAVTAQMENRKFIVCENHLPYFEASQARLANLVAAPYLFSHSD